MEICKRENCTGCGMCTNVCEKNAICMVKNSHGFYYPEIDDSKCISCGLCMKKCPVGILNNYRGGGSQENLCRMG